MRNRQQQLARRSDRRREQRVLQIRRIVDLVVDGRSLPFALCNLSAKGAAGRTIFSVSQGSRITLRFETGLSIAGQVRWRMNGMIGIAFRGTLPPELIQPSSRIHRRREPRFRIEMAGLLTAGALTEICVIRNVGRNGLMIETDAELTPGQIVTVHAASANCCGQVCWTANGTAGIRSFMPMDLDQFDVCQPGDREAQHRLKSPPVTSYGSTRHA